MLIALKCLCGGDAAVLCGSSVTNAGDSAGFRNSCCTRADSWSDHVSTETEVEIMNHFADSYHFSSVQDKHLSIPVRHPQYLTGIKQTSRSSLTSWEICLFAFAELPRVRCRCHVR